MTDFIVTLNNKKHFVKLIDNSKVELNGKVYDVNLTEINQHAFLIKLNNVPFEAAYKNNGNGNYSFLIEGAYRNISVKTRLQEIANEIISNKEVERKVHNCRAPMPGLINKILKKIGENVNIGDPLAILEAMKMENELRSNYKGIVKEIMIKEGDTVEKDSIIMTIE